MSMLRVAALSMVGLSLAAADASAQYRDRNDREWRRGSTYYSGDSWKVFRFSCIYDPQSAQVRSVRYETFDGVSMPGTQPYARPTADSRAFRRCEEAVRVRVRADKNTDQISVNADAADEWRNGANDFGVRGYGEYRSGGDTANFRFYCSYDTGRDRVQAVEYQKVY
jgi:hypothetical protein